MLITALRPMLYYPPLENRGTRRFISIYIRTATAVISALSAINNWPRGSGIDTPFFVMPGEDASPRV